MAFTFSWTDKVQNVDYVNASDVNTLADGIEETQIAISNLSVVASSGQYDDLRGKPAIPTKTSDLTDDVGYLTTSGETASIQYSNYGVSITGSGGVSLGTSSGTIELKADGTGTVELSSTEGEVIIHNLSAPQNDSDAATKKYVDTAISSAVTTALNTAV